MDQDPEAEQRRRFDELFNAARRDRQMVTSQGEPVQRMTHGVSFRPVTTHADARGNLFEMFDPRWNWHPEPFAFAYCFTLRPNVVKGWNIHREHEDRYFVLQGEMKLVLYDTRPGSPTFGEICEIVLSEFNRGIVNVPKDVWHADQNIGGKDVFAVNFPTKAYDHANPDKYRLPIDTPLIPYSFPGAIGW